MKPLFFLSFFLFLSCSTADEQSNENPTPNTKRETTPTTKNKLAENINTISLAYELFAAAIITTDTTKLNDLIHPELGLFIIHSNGALPEIHKIFSMAELKTEKPKLLNLNDGLFATPLLLDDLPFIDCDFPPNFYSKSGCFADTINELRNNPIWELEYYFLSIFFLLGPYSLQP